MFAYVFSFEISVLVLIDIFNRLFFIMCLFVFDHRPWSASLSSVWNSFITREQALLSQIFPANLFPANDFSFNSDVSAPYFRSAFDHFCDALDCFRDLIRDVSREDKCFTWIFLLLLLNLVLGMRLEWCLFPSFKGQTSDVSIVLNYFCCCRNLQKSRLLFVSTEKSSVSKAKIAQANNHCQSLLEAVKFVYPNNLWIRTSISSRKLVTFRKLQIMF